MGISYCVQGSRWNARWSCVGSSGPQLTSPFVSTVDVTLDPDTAYPSLILSDNLRQVRYSYLQQDLPDNPERFNLFPCVLGSPCFIAGRHYWEVEVGDKAKWTIGVCEDSVCRKVGVTSAPQNGFWEVSLWYREEYWALTSSMTALLLDKTGWSGNSFPAPYRIL